MISRHSIDEKHHSHQENIHILTIQRTLKHQWLELETLTHV